jgi:hypothetical protein
LERASSVFCKLESIPTNAAYCVVEGAITGKTGTLLGDNPTGTGRGIENV